MQRVEGPHCERHSLRSGSTVPLQPREFRFRLLRRVRVPLRVPVPQLRVPVPQLRLCVAVPLQTLILPPPGLAHCKGQDPQDNGEEKPGDGFEEVQTVGLAVYGVEVDHAAASSFGRWLSESRSNTRARDRTWEPQRGQRLESLEMAPQSGSGQR